MPQEFPQDIEIFMREWGKEQLSLHVREIKSELSDALLENAEHWGAGYNQADDCAWVSPRTKDHLAVRGIGGRPLTFRLSGADALALMKAPAPASPVSGSMQPHEHVILELARERERQMQAEGWSYEHDDGHDDGAMASAAAAYCIAATPRQRIDPGEHVTWGITINLIAAVFPRSWHWRWWKPTTPRRNLVKAAALIVAEIERIDREAARTLAQEQPGA